MDTQFIIIGPDSPGGGECLVWNNQLGWIEDPNQATTFGREIMTIPLPEGGEGLLELSMDGAEFIAYWSAGDKIVLDS